ncbi:23S rRNA (uracil(1939)-C(5))-methyltransferase RlmD [Caloramator sp. CAR-1]|uniref:23S rRNA (uracil(1939)-C(5))-methyltransferase RlmD n=1 Tax=Caloramator sp. CAR-1 TaxID=3062777 RepID=UPI0026E4426B|nr:23S rRNA (uracil(1939)-C(5))-methyltransferase RlmD [Caloramator sp. CAR-1]MDO6354969.1 23S rRNA (uracil(1939)-C(5))-methyltransferase RlmD [Caloramator sp. CAR-1]
MAKYIPVEVGKIYDIDITGMGFQGEGVGRIENFAIFVKGALKGERVKVEVEKVQKNFAFAKLIEIIKPSKYRTNPICPIYESCGGCQIQHMNYEGQLEFKRERVEDVINRIGKITDAKIHKTIGMEKPLRYRNKVQLPIRREDGEIKIGFFKQGTHEVIDVKECFIQDEVADKVVNLTREWIYKYNIEPYDETNGSGIVRHIMIRRAFETGEVMVVIVTNGGKLPYKEEFIDLMVKNIDALKSIVQNINNKITNVILGEKNILLWGQDHITDYIGKFKFRISPLSFFQVNPVQTNVLYNKALEYANLSGDEIVFDAYCGTGTISLFLAQRAKKVYGVEIIEEAIKNARENARENDMQNVEFIVGKSEEVIPKLIEKGIIPDVVVVDPPRKGCDERLLHSIAKANPKRIVYVSCDPSTLARDLNLLEKLGYKTIEVQPVDMFPQTAHVECCVLIERAEK